MRLASPQFVELPVNGLIPQDTIVNVKTTDIEAMGLAAGGKLVQDIARDTNGAPRLEQAGLAVDKHTHPGSF